MECWGSPDSVPQTSCRYCVMAFAGSRAKRSAAHRSAAVVPAVVTKEGLTLGVPGEADILPPARLFTCFAWNIWHRVNVVNRMNSGCGPRGCGGASLVPTPQSGGFAAAGRNMGIVERK